MMAQDNQVQTLYLNEALLALYFTSINSTRFNPLQNKP